MTFLTRGKSATLIAVLLLLSKLVAPAFSRPIEQIQIEAAMTLQVLSFTKWPDSKESRTIGVHQSLPAFQAFQALAKNERYSGSFSIVAIDAAMPAETLARCDAIYFANPNDTEIPRIVRKLESNPTVLIGSFEGFLEQGGLIQYYKRDKRLTFKIHRPNSALRNIEYRAKLLRLAEIVEQ